MSIRANDNLKPFSETLWYIERPFYGKILKSEDYADLQMTR